MCFLSQTEAGLRREVPTLYNASQNLSSLSLSHFQSKQKKFHLLKQKISKQKKVNKKSKIKKKIKPKTRMQKKSRRRRRSRPRMLQRPRQETSRALIFIYFLFCLSFPPLSRSLCHSPTVCQSVIPSRSNARNQMRQTIFFAISSKSLIVCERIFFSFRSQPSSVDRKHSFMCFSSKNMCRV